MSTIHTIGIAGILAVKAPEQVRTVLGSCVGIAMFDRSAKMGGMAHVILPSASEGTGDPGKFADTAIDVLLQELITHGAFPGRIKAKIAGGASMFGPVSQSGLGERNVAAVRERLSVCKVPIVAEHCGGDKGRKITLDPASGDLAVQIIGQDVVMI